MTVGLGSGVPTTRSRETKLFFVLRRLRGFLRYFPQCGGIRNDVIIRQLATRDWTVAIRARRSRAVQLGFGLYTNMGKTEINKHDRNGSNLPGRTLGRYLVRNGTGAILCLKGVKVIHYYRTRGDGLHRVTTSSHIVFVVNGSEGLFTKRFARGVAGRANQRRGLAQLPRDNESNDECPRLRVGTDRMWIISLDFWRGALRNQRKYFNKGNSLSITGHFS